MKKRLLSCILAVSLVVPSALGNFSIVAQAAESHVPSATGTKVELLEEPFGINTKNPAFSWTMVDEDKDEVQTEYRIVVGATERAMQSGTYLKDTGWVASNESSYVKAELDNVLEDNSLYYWSVQIKDKDGNESEFSEPQAFTTALGTDGWECTEGIWVDPTGPDAFEEAGWTDYTVEMDADISVALGVAIHAKDTNNMYFMQFKTDGTINPHTIYNGGVAAYGTALKSPVALNQGKVRIKLEVSGETVTAYVQDRDGNFQSAGSVTFNKGLTYGSIGFRTGRTESAKVDNIIVYKETSDPVVASSDSKEVAELETEAVAVEGQTETEFLDSGVVLEENTADDNDTNVEEEATKDTEVVESAEEAEEATEITEALAVQEVADESEDTAEELRIEADSKGTENTGRTVLYEQDFETSGKEDFNGISVADGMLNVPLSVVSRLQESAIGAEEVIKPLGNYAFLRNELTIENKEEIEKAVVSVTAKSPEKSRQYVYNLYMNGSFVGLGPARIDKDASGTTELLYYNTYDVTDYLKEGENVMGAINYTTEEKAFLCQMTVFYKDGTKEVLTNSGAADSTWKAMDGTASFGNGANIGTGFFSASVENINAIYFPFGWNSIGYDDSSWTMPLKKGDIAGKRQLAPYDSENVKRYPVAAASVTDKGNGNYFIDLGKEIVGGVYLDVNSPVSKEIEIRCGEELSGTDTVKYQMRTGNTYKQTWTLKEGEQHLENTGMMTFRYIEILNSPIEITTENIGGIAMHQEFSEEESSFQSSDEVLNKIYETMKYSIEATNQDLMVDSQSRERGAYEGDVLINALSSYAFEDDYTLSRFSNEYLINHRTWPLEYVLYTITNAWNDYQYTGNIDSLQEYYSAIKGSGDNRLYWNQLDAEKGLLKIVTSGQNTWNAVLVDWPATEQDGYDRSTYNTVMNAVAYGAYTDLSEIADALGNTEDAQKYQGYADTIKAGMLKFLYDDKAGAFKDGIDSTHYSQHATAFALAFGVYDSQEMADKLAASIKEDGTIKTSVYGSWFLLEGLYNAGAGDTAMDFLLSKDTRSWYHMIYDLGATISAEAWDPANKPNMTYSHPWGSAAGSQIVQGLFGIQPLKAGFDKFQIKIQPGDLESASVKTPTIKGSVEASYNMAVEGDAISANVTIPANTTADVSIPRMGQNHEILYVDGVQQEARVNGEFLTVTLGSGTYNLEIPNAGTISLSVGDDSSQKYYTGNTGMVDVSYKAPFEEAVDAKEVGTLTYTSDNSKVASVNSKTGAISFKSAGNATITVVLTLSDVKIGQTVLDKFSINSSTTIKVDEPKIDKIYIDTKDTLTVGNKANITVSKEYNSGVVVSDGSAEIVSDHPEIVDINSKGQLVAKEAGTATLTSTVENGLTLTDDFDYQYVVDEELYADNFDEGDATFGGQETLDGALHVSKGAKIYFNNADALKWEDYTYAGKFKIASNCGNLTFHVQDSDTFYLWQFRADDNTLKKHIFKKGINTDGYVILGITKLSNLNTSENNDFKIVLQRGKIITYLNGEIVDITLDDTLTKGSVGVRNGSSEECYLDDLTVSRHRQVVTKTITVEKGADVVVANAALEKAETINRELYAEDSLKELDAKSEQLKQLIDGNPEVSRQEEVNTLTTQLNTALNALKERSADTANLSQIIADAQKIAKGDYTNASYKNLTAAIASGQAVLNSNPVISKQAAVNEQTQKIITAIANLKLNEKIEVKEYANLTALKKQIAAAKKVSTKKYTEKSVKTMSSMLKTAENLVNAKPEKSLQGAVDIASKALKASISGLEKKLVYGTTIRKVSREGKGKIKVTWKRNSSASGNLIQYSTDKNFKKGVRTKKIRNSKTTCLTISKLKSGKTYYVRIKSYKVVNGARRFGASSKVLKAKVK